MIDFSKVNFWNTPNRAGVPSFSYDELVAALQETGLSGNAGKGATIERPASLSIPISAITPIVGYTAVNFDDLNFNGPNPDGFTIPDVDPPIQRVALFASGRWFPGFTANTARDFNFLINGSTAGIVTTQDRRYMPSAPVTLPLIAFIASSAIPVSAGDLLQIAVTNFDSVANSFADTLFSITVVI